jgi:hypothetical protein
VKRPLLEAAWAKALYEAWVRYEETPIYNAVVAELGNPRPVSSLG